MDPKVLPAGNLNRGRTRRALKTGHEAREQYQRKQREDGFEIHAGELCMGKDLNSSVGLQLLRTFHWLNFCGQARFEGRCYLWIKPRKSNWTGRQSNFLLLKDQRKRGRLTS